jgi:CHASE3 domain sensor protein
MTIRGKLYTAIVVVVAGFALTVGVGAWAMNRLGDRFDNVQAAADARALALQLKFDVTDFNGWQTAYGYDGGRSRPRYLAAFARFQRDLSRARTALERPQEVRLLAQIEDAARDFARLDARAWAALQAGRDREVSRILLGPEIENFQRAAAAAQALAATEEARAAAQERAFRDARTDALRLLIGASIITALLVVILLVTATDLARTAEHALEASGAPPSAPDP